MNATIAETSAAPLPENPKLAAWKSLSDSHLEADRKDRIKKQKKLAASIRVDPEFKALIPSPTDNERQLLESSLVADGCRDRLVTWNGLLLDGHNRLEICQRLGIEFQAVELSMPDRNEATSWIIRNQFGRRNLTPYQRAELALKLEPLIAKKAKEKQREHGGTAPGKSLSQKSDEVSTKKELAKSAGVSHDTIHKAKAISERASEPVKEKLRRGETTINKEYRTIVKAQAKVAADARAAATALPLGEGVTLICADITEANEVQNESVDWIVTDPPYPKEFLPVYDKLATFASRVLRPGGSVLAMVGQSYLPQVMASLSARLSYNWILTYLTFGQSTHIWDRKVNTFFKPVLWMTKGKYTGRSVIDVVRSDRNDKEYHHWGQSERGMEDMIQQFTDAGQTICDPFLGGGTTGVVSVGLGRPFIGIDIDAGCVERSRIRIAAAAQPKDSLIAA